MAIHTNPQSMLNESLPEMLLAAKYCIEFRKDTSVWKVSGCYGYPAALLLLSMIDSVGSYIEKGNVLNHFKILNNTDCYNLDLNKDEVKVIYDYYRNTLSHHSVLPQDIMLDIGQKNEKIFERINNMYILRLVPLYNLSLEVVKKLLNNQQILENNVTIHNIENKKII